MLEGFFVVVGFFFVVEGLRVVVTRFVVASVDEVSLSLVGSNTHVVRLC